MATIQEIERPRATDAFQIPTTRFDGATGPRIIGPRDGKAVDLGSVGVRFMVWGAETSGSFSLVEHAIPPRTLAARDDTVSVDGDSKNFARARRQVISLVRHVERTIGPEPYRGRER